MSTSIPPNTKAITQQSGSALVISMIVLAILGAIAYASLDVADLNIIISANDRDTKEAFFHADSGVNIGHEFLEEAIDIANSTFYSDGTHADARTWRNSTDFNATHFPATWYTNGTLTTYVRSGALDADWARGSAMQIGAGYEGVGKGAASGGTIGIYLIRAHREGRRNSVAEVDLGWRHINY